MASPSSQRTYQDALDHLNQLIPNRAVTSLFQQPQSSSNDTSSKPKEDPNLQAIPEMLTWLRRVGYAPSDLAALKCIHVAGTKGKGSVCAYLTSMLTSRPETAGKVGTYTSPHLVSPRERIAIDGAPISRALFARYFFEVWDRLTEAAKAEGTVADDTEAEGPTTKPFYFRYLTFMAFHAFLSEGVRSAVIEVGIGGAYDATNVLPSEAVSAAVVTQLGIDHVAMLGETAEEIAWHKAGIMKKGVPAFTRRLKDEGTEDKSGGVMGVLRRRAAELQSRELIEVSDEDVETWGGVRDGGRMKGAFQRHNQALAALAAEEHLAALEGRKPTRRLKEVSQDLIEAMGQAALRGRQEVIVDDKRGVRWLLDGAHTTESLSETAKWLVAEVEATPQNRVVLLFNQQERQASKLLRGFLDDLHRALRGGKESADRLFHAAVFSRNDLPADQAKSDGEPDLTVQEGCLEAFATIHSGVRTTTSPGISPSIDEIGRFASELRETGISTTVLVTGSLHLVGNTIRLLEPEGAD